MSNKEFSASLKKINPFGPALGLIKIDSPMLDALISLTDDILDDSRSKSHGSRLAGQIENEKTVPIEMLQERDLYSAINGIQLQFINTCLDLQDRPMSTVIREAWIVSQHENEYNPAHWHEGCTLSSVIYLKIPDYKPRDIPGKESQDGKIVFIGGSNPGQPAQSLETPFYVASPEPGDMFIFPSRLLHVVYPFQGPGERRSVSLNGFHFFNDSIPEDIKKLL